MEKISVTTDKNDYEPYFVQNKDWYYYDEKEGRCKLTEKAPPEAVKSYNEWYEE